MSASVSLVSCSSSTSGCARSSHHATFSRRALREFTFQVAMRTRAVYPLHRPLVDGQVTGGPLAAAAVNRQATAPAIAWKNSRRNGHLRDQLEVARRLLKERGNRVERNPAKEP